MDVTGSTPLNCRWRHNGLEVQGAAGLELNLPEVTREHAGLYTVEVSNSAGTTFSQPFRLRVVSGLDDWQWHYPQPVGHPIFDVVFGWEQFVAVGSSGSLLTSLDGLGWVLHPNRYREVFEHAAIGNGTLLISVNDFSLSTIWARYAETDFELRPLKRPGFYCRDLLYAAGCFVAVGGRYGAYAPSWSYLLVSTDGYTWFERSAVCKTMILTDVAYANGTFVALGRDGIILSLPIATVTLDPSVDYFTPERFSLTISGDPGSWVLVEGSSDLIHWLPVAGTSIGAEPQEVFDTTVPVWPHRFYRAVAVGE
jgi:hypothetical protein